MARISAAAAGGTNRVAYLDMLGVSEIGAQLLAESDDGYNVLVGSTAGAPLLFHSYVDHPNVYNKALNSTAAGRYQLLHRWWPAYKTLLKLHDFSPVAQDMIALQQIRERRALPLIDAGRIEEAISACRNIWASLPGAGYNQHENNLADLVAAYQSFGGVIV